MFKKKSLQRKGVMKWKFNLLLYNLLVVRIIIITIQRQVGYYKISIYVNEWLQYGENEKAAAL